MLISTVLMQNTESKSRFNNSISTNGTIKAYMYHSGDLIIVLFICVIWCIGKQNQTGTHAYAV